MAKKTVQSNQLQILKKSLREGNAERLYIFHGEEVFLLNYYLQQLKKMLIDDLTESFNYHKLTSETFDIRSFADAVESLPMMAEYTLIVVDDIDIFKLTDEERTKLSEVICDIPEYCTVVFTYETVAWKPDKRYKKLWDAVQSNAVFVEFEKQDHGALVSWITRHFTANGKKIAPELCRYLIDVTGGTMTALAGEIAKICAYSGADTIAKSDIDAVTEPVLDAVVFQMTNHMSNGAYGAALQTLQQLFKLQQEPLSILGAIGAHFRRLSAARVLSDHGKNMYDLMKLCGLQEYPARNTMEAGKRFTPAFYEAAAHLIMETDRAIKTSLDTPERLLEMLIIDLAREARNG